MDVNSLTHTKWNCKHHIAFASFYKDFFNIGISILKLNV